ncbi:hypothetical protein LBMAG56_05510 [Verrucomicrobiota bacterium]|nr:hypothetical protein LBMAG56_05510 [Verrucomicrobiota bacterium]
MKTLTLLGLALTASRLVAGPQPPPPNTFVPGPQPPPPVTQVITPSASPKPLFVYEQRPFSAAAKLVTAEQAQAILGQFKAALPKLGAPRFAIQVNRVVIEDNAAAPATGTTNSTPAAPAPVTPLASRPPTLTDKLTFREVEKLFGRPLRIAEAALSDLPESMFTGLEKTSSRNPLDWIKTDREALSRLADVVIEVLISSRSVSVREISGDRVYTAPDIQATAIRLRDSQIIGQANATDLLARQPNLGAALRANTIQEFTESVALVLMQDIALNVK